MDGLLGKVKSVFSSIVTYAALGAIALGTYAAIVSYRYEVNRTKRVPIVFSEKTALIKEAEARGERLPPEFHFLSSEFDFVNKIREIWNDSWSDRLLMGGDPYLRFARQLGVRMSWEEHTYNIGDLLEQIPIEAQALIDELSPYQELLMQVRIANRYLDDAWKHTQEDHDRHWTETEYYTDSDGNEQSRTVWKSEYDYSDYHFRYNPKAGEESVEILKVLISDFDSLSYVLELPVAKVIQDSNRRAARESRVESGDDIEFADSEYLVWAATYRNGSELFNHRAVLAAPMFDLTPSGQKWIEASKTARSKDYKHYDGRNHPGPKENQACDKALGNAQSLERSLNAMFGSLYGSISLHEQINVKIGEILLVSRDGNLDFSLNPMVEEAGVTGEQLRPMVHELMDLVHKKYEVVFSEGFNTDRYRGGMPYLWGFLGVIGGGAIGAGLAFAAKKGFSSLSGRTIGSRLRYLN